MSQTRTNLSKTWLQTWSETRFAARLQLARIMECGLGQPFSRLFRFLPRHTICISAAYAVMWCLCVCICVRVSVTFVSCVKTNKHIIKLFSPSGSHTILVFPCQTAWQYSDGDPPNGGVECRWGRSRFWGYLALVLAVNAATCQVLSTGSPVNDGHRLASYDTSLVVSGGVDSGSDKSVAFN